MVKNHPPDRSVLSDDNPCSCIGVTDGDAGDREVGWVVRVTRGTVNDQDPDRPGGPGALQGRWHDRGKTMNTYGRSLTSNNTSLIDYPWSPFLRFGLFSDLGSKLWGLTPPPHDFLVRARASDRFCSPLCPLGGRCEAADSWPRVGQLAIRGLLRCSA